MQQLTAGLKGPSAKIRALHKAGFSRSEIAKFLGKRYQHVRNVIVGDETRQTQAAGFAEGDASGASATEGLRPTKVRLGPDGRVVIPAPFREALGLKEGDVLFASIDEGEIHLLTSRAAMRRAQAIVRQFVPAGVSLVDELIEDRRKEVEHEAKHG